MDTKQIRLVNDIARRFCFGFIDELNAFKSIFKNFKMNLSDALPEVFKNYYLYITFIYSEDRNNVLIVFNKVTNNSANYNSILHVYCVKGNVFDSIGKGFIEYKGNGQIVLENCRFNNFTIDYASAMGFENLISKTTNLKQYVSDFISSYWEKFLRKGDKNELLNYLSFIKNRMKELFFNPEIPELEIDNFIANNPIILERGLFLINPLHQVVLKNILDIYEHDLKPDLIAYDIYDKQWLIIDYKRAKRSIIKNVNKVRTGFTADVNNLENQLWDYVEYFQEDKQRKYFNKTYNIDIILPDAIGIIGNVKFEEQNAFNRLMKNKPKWFKVVPYNYLYDNFCRYIEMTENIIKNRGEYFGR